ncbi:putative GPI-anchored cell surface glycoprotein [Aspergillus undulatus]|uniref:putative GPI-anchored cell surface glycoprotein n=1 Tax=Aspergillus undulatus TaxID=1810928 RepID=UPI003CCCD180
MPVRVLASVSRELGSPAALPDLSLTQTRRSSSRASQRTAPEMTTSNPTQSSYSLPPTPLAPFFEEFLPSTKRRRTQRAIQSGAKTPPSGITETPTHRAFSEPFQSKSHSSSARPTRTSNLAQVKTRTPQAQDTLLREADPGTPSASNANPPASEQAQPDQQADQNITPRKLPSRQNAVTVKAEPDKETLTDSGSSMPTRLDLAGQENGATPSKTSTSRASTPQSPRRDRRPRRPSDTGAKITKPSTASKPQSTPASTAKTKPQENGTANSITPAKQSATATPTTSTRTRRRDRKSTRTNEQTPGSTQAGERPPLRSPNKHSNTITLNVGRKSMESFLAQKKSHDLEIAHVDTNDHAENGDYHFDYDSEMYGNNDGPDGHRDAPNSPTSFSSTTSNAARHSGRTRKPTIRALESLESEKRSRRFRASSTARSKQEPASQSPNSERAPPRKPDVMILAKQIYELAAAAVAPDFASPPEVDTWLKELQQKVDEKEKEKDAQPEAEPEAEPVVETEVEPETEPEIEPEVERVVEPEQQPKEPAAEVEVEEEGARETTPDPSKPFSENVQASMPWTDKDGWEHTGQINKHEEEYVIVPSEYEWFRPNNTYEDDELPLPPIRIRSLVQAERDRAFGYPPRLGDRNIPVDNQGFFLLENVPEEKAKLKTKEEARARGIYVTKFMALEEIENMINLYDNGQPPVPPILDIPDVPVEIKQPSRKRRRTDTTSNNKPADTAETPKPKRRRQESGPTTPAEPDHSAPDHEAETPPEKKSLKITLTFGNKRLLMEQAALADANGTGQINNNTQSTQVPSTPAKPADSEKANTQVTPSSAEQYSNETTPGGRPRRRAADALMANFQKHAEARAQRSERARLGHARRKGTPLKTVTGIHGDTVESPIRPAVNSMNVD